MSGTITLGGKTLASHSNDTDVAKIQLGSSNDVVLADSSGNNILSESGGTVSLTNTTIKNIPVFKAQLSSSQNTTSNVETKLILSDEVIDSHNFFDATTNYRFQPTIAGYYKFDATVFVNGAPTTFYLIFYKNGTGFNQGATDFNGSYSSNGVIGSTIIELNGSTDYVELYAKQVAATGFYNSTTFKSYLTGYLISGT